MKFAGTMASRIFVCTTLINNGGILLCKECRVSMLRFGSLSPRYWRLLFLCLPRTKDRLIGSYPSILNANLSTAVFFSFHSCGKKRIRQWKESKILVARKIISTFTASFCRFREHFFPKFAASFPQFSINH